jgi:ABC-type Fe3+-hydroxamate transport system substrate-binding protein
MIADFGQFFNKRTEAQKWMDEINFALQDFKEFIKDKPLTKVAYFIWANPYMVAGKDTYINELLRLNHFQNIYENIARYPQVDLKKIRLEGDPDLILLSSEPFPFKDEQAFEIGLFTHHATTIFVDGEYFSWHGSRILKAFDYFKLLHQKL